MLVRRLFPYAFFLCLGMGIAALGATVARETGQANASQGQQAVSEFEGDYEWHETYIPMRDGVKLHSVIITPRDLSKRYPILLTRTPYGSVPERLMKQLDPLFAKAGYIFVCQDVRGRGKSEGKFIIMTPEHDPGKATAGVVDESTDAYDTIDWLIKNVPNHNGRVGLKGVSYNGFYAAAGLIDAHPALKAVSPQAPQADWFVGDDIHHHGAFTLVMGGGGQFNVHPPDAYRFFLDLGSLANVDAKFLHGHSPGWTEITEHGTYDSYWRSRNILPHLRDIRPAVLTMGGWYDAYNLYGALHVFSSIESQSPGTRAALVIGPWYHGQWVFGWGDSGESIGPFHFSTPTADIFRKNIELPFFEHYLRDGPDLDLPAAYMFDTGADAWSKFTAWPPKESIVKSLYFEKGGRLSFDLPKHAPRGFDEYVSDPAHPVPFTPKITGGMDRDYMTEDQRFAATRPDVLVYRSEPLESDVTVVGSVVPHLFVSTTGTDSDWIVKLIDVHPDNEPKPMGGYEAMIRGDVVRAKFRNSLENPQPMVPGKVTPIEFNMLDAFHTFKKGHRIMVQIQSTWFPLIDRDPQKFVDIYKASDADFQKVTERLYFGKAAQSRLDMRVLSNQ
jgi:predicted acyl esterase